MNKPFCIFLIFFIVHQVYAQNVGINNINPQAALDINGDIRLRSHTLTFSFSYQHDLDISTHKYSVYKIDPTATTGAIITGMNGGTDGRIVTFINTSTAWSLQFFPENDPISALSLETNRFVSPIGQPIVVSPSGSASFRYDGTKMRWTALSSSFTEGIDTYPNVWPSNGLDIYNNNIGNVGIGVVSPSEKLEVFGNIKTNGEIKPNGVSGQLNEVLTSNGDGTMQWTMMSGSGSNSINNNGSWGDCSMNNIDDFFPVASDDGTSDDKFGSSVAISGEYAIVGIPFDDEGAANCGSASIYMRNSNTGEWELKQNLENQNVSQGDGFGSSVAINGDYAIVGSPYDTESGLTNTGSVCIFKRNLANGLWELQGNKILNQAPAANDLFGYSVGLNGEYAIVGSPYDSEYGFIETGTISIYKRNNNTGNWELQGNKIANVNYNNYDRFGFSVMLHGDFAIVGAPSDSENGLNANGTAMILKRNGANGLWEYHGSKLIDPAASNGEYFGTSVSIFGNHIIIGIPGDGNQGSIMFYSKNTSTGFWNNSGTKFYNFQPNQTGNFGHSVSISGDFAIAGGIYTYLGSVMIYKRILNIWRPFQKVVDPAAIGGGDFGRNVSIDHTNHRFVIGSQGIQANQGMAFFGKIK